MGADRWKRGNEGELWSEGWERYNVCMCHRVQSFWWTTRMDQLGPFNWQIRLSLYIAVRSVQFPCGDFNQHFKELHLCNSLDQRRCEIRALLLRGYTSHDGLFFFGLFIISQSTQILVHSSVQAQQSHSFLCGGLHDRLTVRDNEWKPNE